MKIVKIRPVGKRAVYDLSVQDAEHYVLKNGVVTHNTGPMYSSNAVWIIGRRTDKVGTEVQGYHFIINIEKSRFVKEKSKIPISVSWEGGIMKWSGLLEVAQEGAFVQKPKNGWYTQHPDPAGPAIGKAYREKDCQTADFWKPLLTNKDFCQWVTEKYSIGEVAMYDQAE